MVKFSPFLIIFLFLSAMVVSSDQSSIFEGAFLKYEISVFGQPKHLFSFKRAKELYESLKIPMGKMLFLASLQNATGRVQTATFARA